METRKVSGTGSQAVKTGTVEANGTSLYCEVRGSGPSVLFISGATGDAGHFDRVASLLADEFTVVTYDRRGNSRSPRPAGWTTTSTDEQGDDAAGLLEALSLAPAAVFGNSGGAIIGLNCIVRHPQVVRAAVLYEPPLLSVLADPESVMTFLQPIIQQGMATAGPPGAVEAFLRAVGVNTDELNPALRERLLGNGETLFGIEFGKFEPYRPDASVLGALQRPVQVIAGTESPAFFVEAAQWLATGLGVELRRFEGGHVPHFDRPEKLAQNIRPFLKQHSYI